jgi:hypothetical protein
VIETIFYVARGLEQDVHIGHHSLNSLQPFRFNQDDFERVQNVDNEAKMLARIVEVGITSKFLDKGKEMGGRLFASIFRIGRNQDLERQSHFPKLNTMVI